jgi:hypothetical protein
MEKIKSLFSNVSDSPKTTIIGLIFMLVGVLTMERNNFEDLTLNSVGVVFFAVGGYLSVSKDKKNAG